MAKPRKSAKETVSRGAKERPQKEDSASALAVHFARSSIVGAAMEVFARQGVEATRVEDLLQAAGIARRTFYRYFDNKEEVLAALYQVVTEKLALALASAQRSGSDPLEGVRLGIDVYFDFHVSQGPLLRVLVEHAVRRESPLFPHRRRFQEALVSLLDDTARSIHGVAFDPLLYLALIGALETVSLDLLRGEPEAHAVTRAKRVVLGLLELAMQSPIDELRRAFPRKESGKRTIA